jgi:hypothetical protein
MAKSTGPVKREQLYYLRSEILDNMAYVLVNAPEFPEEDQTSLERERERITGRLSKHRSTLRTEDQLTWHSLAEQEIAAAFGAYSSGDEHTGCRQLQQAEEHFRRSFKPKKIRSDFVVGTGGEITKT